MKKVILLIVTIFFISCNEGIKTDEIKIEHNSEINIERELELIEQTRNSFQKAFKEKRYGDLNRFIMEGFKGVPPGSEDWQEYNRLGKKPTGQFSVDSISMRPQETSVVSDSVAYEFGTSSVFYKNSDGESIELKNTFLMILKKDKIDGKWKLYRDVSSSVVE
jgi:ketosteroid isomerase-like protein